MAESTAPTSPRTTPCWATHQARRRAEPEPKARDAERCRAAARRGAIGHIGQPWDQVSSELRPCPRARNAVHDHVQVHLDDFVATQVQLRWDALWVLRPHCGLRPVSAYGGQALYVDPASGPLLAVPPG